MVHLKPQDSLWFKIIYFSGNPCTFWASMPPLLKKLKEPMFRKFGCEQAGGDDGNEEQTDEEAQPSTWNKLMLRWMGKVESNAENDSNGETRVDGNPWRPGLTSASVNGRPRSG